MSANHFQIQEFACRCGCGGTSVSEELIEKLNLARIYAGVPFIITSGYRCTKHNAAVGGVANSAHVKGLACDIAVNSETKPIILKAVQKYFIRYGVSVTFIHVDVDKTLPQLSWVYGGGEAHVA